MGFFFKRRRTLHASEHVDKHHERAEKTLSEGIREAERKPAAERLHEPTLEAKGKPEAVNLEREDPVTSAARRRDSF